MTRQENGHPRVTGPRRSGEPTSPFGASAVLPEIPSVRGRARAEQGRLPKGDERLDAVLGEASPSRIGEASIPRLAACFTASCGSGRRADRASPGQRSTLGMALRPAQAGAQLDPKSCEWAIHPDLLSLEWREVCPVDEGAGLSSPPIASAWTAGFGFRRCAPGFGFGFGQGGLRFAGGCSDTRDLRARTARPDRNGRDRLG